MRLYFILITFLIIQNCSLNKQNGVFGDLANKIQKKDDSSVVILKTNVKRVSFSGAVFDANFGKFEWCNKDNGECNKLDIKKLHTNEQYAFYEVKPGFYYLNDIYQLNRAILPFGFVVSFVGADMGFFSPSFNLSISGWNKELKAPNFTSFETKPGEIVYIGDINFSFMHQKHWIRGKINLDIQDNYDEAVKYFREKFPEYKNKPVIKRLAQPGILLDDYDAGIFW